MRTLKQLAAAAAVAVLAPLLVAAPAHADWTSNVAYKRESSYCANDGDKITIGGKVFQKELGKHGVYQFRVTYLVYTVDPSSAGIHTAFKKLKLDSGAFPDDKQSFGWHPQRYFHLGAELNGLPMEYWLTAKLTWVRGGRPDWNYKLPLAHCS